MLDCQGESRVEKISNGEADTESGTSTKRERDAKEKYKGLFSSSLVSISTFPLSPPLPTPTPTILLV